MRAKKKLEEGRGSGRRDVSGRAERDGVIRKVVEYVDRSYRQGRIQKDLYRDVRKKAAENLATWWDDPNIARVLPTVRDGIRAALKARRLEDIVYAFMDDIAFGTAGIRGIVTFTDEELEEFARRGKNAVILRGPNTINEVVLLLKSVGVAAFAAQRGLKAIVIGYDSRLQGDAFAELIARLFLVKGLRVYLFNRVASFPEVAFAVPFLKADIGILISASHNDKRYNGYKLISSTGAQFNVKERNYIYENFIRNASLADIELAPMDGTMKKRLVLLGEPGRIRKEYAGLRLLDIRSHHIAHIKKFVLDVDMVKGTAPRVCVGYASYHGAGRNSVPPILKEFGFRDLKIIRSLYRVDGRFPCFLPEQQPDPGDPVSAGIAVREFVRQYGRKAFERLDILLGTDPDADRVGIIVKVPEAQRSVYREIVRGPEYIRFPASLRKQGSDGSWVLLDADTAWTLLMWYRLEKRRAAGWSDTAREFIVLNHNTTDALVALARKHGLGVIKTWVGFAMISDSVAKTWQGLRLSPERNPESIYRVMDMEGRRINAGAFEQSSGFSIFGGPPRPGQSLGENGHVRDKDGTLAAILLAEIAAYAKSLGKTLVDLVDEKIYLDPDVGMFITYYEPEPYWGQYEGLTGISRKIEILRNADRMRGTVECGGIVLLAGRRVTRVETYRTGKYDRLHRWDGFPDEGIRFFFGSDFNHITVRPSGTSQCLRLHVQWKVEGVSRDNLLERKREGHALCRTVMKEFREYIGLLKTEERICES